jgi:hypothetical protein
VAGIAAVPARADAAGVTWTRIEVQNISGSKATVAWSTDVSTTGVVRFGTSASNLTNFLGDSQLRAEHATELVNLQPKKKYYFVVTARDASGNEATSFTFNFTTGKLTQAEEDEIDANRQSPSGANGRVGVDGVGATVAAISWSSIAPTRGTVKFNELGSTRSRTTARTALGTTGQTLLKSLKPATVYEYTITMRDSDGDVASVRGPFRFTTADSREQETTPLRVAYLGPSSAGDARLSPTAATVQFSTNHLANATVSYKSTTKKVSSSGTVKITRYGFQHQANLANLKPNVEYEVTVTAKDAFGKTLKLATQKLRTPAVGRAAPSPAAPRVAGASDGPAGRLVKSTDSSTVYYVYPSGRRKPFASEAAFFSYGHRFSDVQAITPQQLAAIPPVLLLKSTASQSVYLLDGSSLRPIVNEAAFLRAGYRWADVELASPTDVQSYPLGTPITE